MTTITTNDIRVKNAVNLRESLISTSLDNLSYLFIGGVLPWENEELPPIPDNNFRTFYDVHDQMVAMKRINERDVYHMIPKVRYTSGVIYDIYRHDYSLINRSYSGASNLYDALFFVINSLNEVYVCLFNNNNKKSTVEPRSNSYVPFYTSDGYQWLKMYTLSTSMVTEHSTENFIPISDDESHISVQGPVYTVIIESPGNNYTINPDGVVNRVLKYYCRIVGDGTGGVATVSVRDGKVKGVKVVRPGTNYTYATLDFTKGRVYESLLDLDQDMNGLNPLGDGTFRSTCIIAPPNGWGTDIVRQLGGTRLGIFSDLNYNLLDFVFESSFRQIGIIRNPLSDSRFPEEFDTLSACYAIATSQVRGPDRYIIGETIIKSLTLKVTIFWSGDRNLFRFQTNNRSHTSEPIQLTIRMSMERWDLNELDDFGILVISNHLSLCNLNVTISLLYFLNDGFTNDVSVWSSDLTRGNSITST